MTKKKEKRLFNQKCADCCMFACRRPGDPPLVRSYRRGAAFSFRVNQTQGKHASLTAAAKYWTRLRLHQEVKVVNWKISFLKLQRGLDQRDLLFFCWLKNNWIHLT